MATITLEVPDEVASRLVPLRDRLHEIIELGLRQMESDTTPKAVAAQPAHKTQVLAALRSTGVVTVPEPGTRSQPRLRRTPIQAGGQPASEIIIEERRRRQ